MIVDVAFAFLPGSNGIFVAKRNAYSSNPLKWEFPGGKILPAENPQEAIIREMYEEFSMVVQPIDLLKSFVHEYPHLTIRLFPVVCFTDNPEFVLHEHADAGFYIAPELWVLDFCEADRRFVDFLRGTP